jgi:hypothetical protein
MNLAEALKIVRYLAYIRVAPSLIALYGAYVTLIVFSRESFNKSSASFYFRVLAINDLNNIFVLVHDLYFIFSNGIDIMITSSQFCQVFTYFFNLFAATTGWILAAFVFDQMAIIFDSKMLDFMKKISFRFIFASILILVHSLMYLVLPFCIHIRYVKVDPTNSSSYTLIPNCDASSLPFFGVFNIINVLDTVLLPFCAILVISALTVRKLLVTGKNLKIENCQMSAQTVSDRRNALNSIVLSLGFLIFLISVPITHMFPFKEFLLYKIWLNIAFTIFNLNSFARFFVLLTVNSKFRKEFKSLYQVKYYA